MKKNDLMEECRKKFSDLKIQQRVNLEVGYIDRAYMIGYNEACEKALEWLKLNLTSITDEPFDSISVVVTDFKTRESVLSNFKAKIHPYSVEQIDNCIKEE